LKEIVTAGNCPWWLIDSDSLCVWKCANALSGTGFDAPLLLLLPPDPPEPPPPPVPLLLEPVLEDPVVLERVVPLCDVFALDDVLVVVLVLVSTEDCAVELVDCSAEVDETLDVSDVELEVLEDSADVEAAADETPLVALAVNSPLLAAVLPAPAPEDDPAVFEACAATVPVVDACT
jgi:hypothetical protein